MGRALDEQLIIAVKQGEKDRAKKLIKAGASVSCSDSRGITALEWAILMAQDKIFEELMELGAEADDGSIAGIMLHQSALKDRAAGSFVYVLSKGNVAAACDLMRAGFNLEKKNVQVKAAAALALRQGLVREKISAGEMQEFMSFPGIRKMFFMARKKNASSKAAGAGKQSGRRKKKKDAGR